ncbi:MAG: ATP-binding protein [Hydrogenophaga sp.]|uniref:ATP-binding protein n=1 Tax=Hydrogenophaga sp. TaxID=1904254 RepID=UPI00262FE776|nr:ATP-binding protein [Hydrogenophaga sp.]MDM7944479.1 ATP-binding protein [Hydrogenophaga sp.]
MCNGQSQTRSGRLLITGAPGTGQTAFGQWIASELCMPHLAYEASDLLGPHLGETQQKIESAFALAREQNALLLFDEGDTFLQQRQAASRHWETTQVNQMLTELDNHEGLFIASTNLLERLEKASLRRFDMTLHLGLLSRP